MQQDDREEIFPAKRDNAARHASKAAAEGQKVLLYRCQISTYPSYDPGPLTDEADVIEAIEQQGWRLEHLAYNRPGEKQGALVMMFRASPNHG